MINSIQEWNPTSPKAWSKVLGLVHVPMFGALTSHILSTSKDVHSVLLDGNAVSFSISVTDDPDFPFKSSPLSWSWSANLRHAVIIDQNSMEMYLRRWDTPLDTFRRFKAPKNPHAAIELFEIIQKGRPPRVEDVMLYVLRAFRQIRNSLPSDDSLNALYLLNSFLLGTESVRLHEITKQDWLKCRTVKEVLEILNSDQKRLAGVDNITLHPADLGIGGLCSYFLSSSISNIHLEPSLLLRHAAGQLYQEAHITLDREIGQLSLPGLASEDVPRGLLKRDVRFTPPMLARSLVQQAFKAHKTHIEKMTSIEILDPACGSGIFLQEALRELIERKFTGHVTLRGFDLSSISCAIASFCLGRAKQDVPNKGPKVKIDIQKCDSLLIDWGHPNFIMMNPPFIPWNRMVDEERCNVQDVLGELGRGRIDMAMAFIWKAIQCLKPDSILASVVPTPLYETQSGQKWREALSSASNLVLLGRFESYGFFRGAMVEPGFILVEGRGQNTKAKQNDIKVVLAEEGYEDAALRALRQETFHTPITDHWEIFSITPDSISPNSWLPRSSKYMKLSEDLSAIGMTTVADLFDVHQGIRTGCNKAFILNINSINSLTSKERRFFRPIASNSTIRDGTLRDLEYVFYPYGIHLPELLTENDLQKFVPKYYEKWLEPNKNELSSRARFDKKGWWLLSQYRAWQMTRKPKLVSTYFGLRGSFAFDETGDFAVVQGHGWLWKQNKKDGESDTEFYETYLPWAYLAILNSGIFEKLLQSFCPRVQGGQFNLSPRFVKNVFLPDLSDDLNIPAHLLRQLVEVGKKIHKGYIPEVDVIDGVVEKAYRIKAH